MVTLMKLLQTAVGTSNQVKESDNFPLLEQTKAQVIINKRKMQQNPEDSNLWGPSKKASWVSLKPISHLRTMMMDN